MAVSDEALTKDKDEVATSPTGESNGSSEQDGGSTTMRGGRWCAVYHRLAYVPPRCRYDPEKPFQFSMSLNVLFGTSILPVSRVDLDFQRFSGGRTD